MDNLLKNMQDLLIRVVEDKLFDNLSRKISVLDKCKKTQEFFCKRRFEETLLVPSFLEELILELKGDGFKKFSDKVCVIQEYPCDDKSKVDVAILLQEGSCEILNLEFKGLPFKVKERSSGDFWNYSEEIIKDLAKDHALICLISDCSDDEKNQKNQNDFLAVLMIGFLKYFAEKSESEKIKKICEDLFSGEKNLVETCGRKKIYGLILKEISKDEKKLERLRELINQKLEDEVESKPSLKELFPKVCSFEIYHRKFERLTLYLLTWWNLR